MAASSNGRWKHRTSWQPQIPPPSPQGSNYSSCWAGESEHTSDKVNHRFLLYILLLSSLHDAVSVSVQLTGAWTRQAKEVTNRENPCTSKGYAKGCSSLRFTRITFPRQLIASGMYVLPTYTHITGRMYVPRPTRKLLVVRLNAKCTVQAELVKARHY